MGLGGISPWSLLLILAIVLLLFGTKRLKNLGGDLGGAIKGFKNAMSDEDKAQAKDAPKSVEQDNSESVTTEKATESEKAEK